MSWSVALTALLGLILMVLTLPGPEAAPAAAAPPETPTGEEILKRLKPEHPRLLATDADFRRVAELAAADPLVRSWHERLKQRAERILQDPPSKYEIPDGLRLLSTSRRVVDRVYTLGLFYKLERDRRYLDRLWRELEAAAQFPDWNPRHFLDTAEMTHAFAIAYDWFHGDWTPEQRRVLREAMVKHGLTPALQSYRGGQSYGWWVKSEHNWNQVCNGGIGVGALALGDEEPALAGEILSAAIKSLPLAMVNFAPDGAWSEGPGYWAYATQYNVLILAALQSALGTDYGLSDIEGFSKAGLFPLYNTGPLGRTFNYADGGDATIRAPQLFWFARRYQLPACADYERRNASPQPLDLLWYVPESDGGAGSLPLDTYFREAEVVSLRSAWGDRDALFVGFKAGDNKANHSNLDLGTFVLDALGYRWAVDLGADNYNLPQYFGGLRWTYYRMRAESHNTLVLNPDKDPDQDPRAEAKVALYRTDKEHALAVADLTAAYARHARAVRRGISLLPGRKQVLVQDEVEADRPAEVWWFLHTPAEVEVAEDGSLATLKQGDARLEARLLSPAKARFTVMDAKPLPSSPQPEGQNPNQGIRKLAVQVKEARDLRLAVLLTPLRPGETAPAPPDLRPLSEWR